ncbi:UNVERIFIED_CONTAM: hypothetical protein Scaly_1047900 [Sesamum calycinum]|uniref:RING-type domain-containing protein n=1 Tax=Sesamum calycinum TaxID=2727403 RepID=A0AAW2QLA7_9LAMI
MGAAWTLPPVGAPFILQPVGVRWILPPAGAPSGLPPMIAPWILPPAGAPLINLPAMNRPFINLQPVGWPLINLPTVDRPLINLPDVNRPLINLQAMDRPFINLPALDRPLINLPDVSRPLINHPNVDGPLIDLPNVDGPRSQPADDAPRNQPEEDVPEMMRADSKAAPPPLLSLNIVTRVMDIFIVKSQKGKIIKKVAEAEVICQICSNSLQENINVLKTECGCESSLLHGKCAQENETCEYCEEAIQYIPLVYQDPLEKISRTQFDVLLS